jgi:hypothetical protein
MKPVTRKDGRRWNAALYDPAGKVYIVACGYGEGGSWTRRYFWRWVAKLKARQMLWSRERSARYANRKIGTWQ